MALGNIKPRPRRNFANPLDELLLVEVYDYGAGLDFHGNKREITITRETYNNQKDDVNMRILEVLKPAGILKANYDALLKKKGKENESQRKARIAKEMEDLKDKRRAEAEKEVEERERILNTPLADLEPEEQDLKVQLESETLLEAIKKGDIK